MGWLDAIGRLSEYERVATELRILADRDPNKNRRTFYAIPQERWFRLRTEASKNPDISVGEFVDIEGTEVFCEGTGLKGP